MSKIDVAEEIEKQMEVITKPQIRKGGKQKMGKPQLKHNNFFIKVDTGICTKGMKEEEIKALFEKGSLVCKELLQKIESEFLIMNGSQQAFKIFKLPIEDTRENLWERVEGDVKARYTMCIGKQTENFFFCLLFAISKRGLDTQIETFPVQMFVREKLGHKVNVKITTYRESKALENYQIYLKNNLSP